MSTLFNVWRVDGSTHPLPPMPLPLSPPKVEGPERIWPLSWAFHEPGDLAQSEYERAGEAREKLKRIVEREQKEARNPYQLPTKESPHTSPPRPPLLAAQVMNSPVRTLDEETPLRSCWEFVQETRYRHVPIVKKTSNGRRALCGIISDRDLMREALLHFKKPGRINPQVNAVKDFMVNDVVSALAHTPVAQIAQLLLSRRIGCMPVCDEEGELIGMITRSDLLRLAARAIP